MNTLIRKEVRLLLPSFVIGLLLALSIWLFPGQPNSSGALREGLVVLLFMVSPAMLVTMTVGAFGREISAGTFSLLLAQPVSRSRVWWTKALLLAVAVILLWAAWWFSLSSNAAFRGNSEEDQRDVLFTTGLFVIAAYSGGLWTTLLFRQVAAAFWFTVLTPAALAMAVVAALHKRGEAVDPTLGPTLVIVFSIYGVAGFLFARWLFLRAQDAPWTGGHVALPELRGLARWFGRRGERRQWRPRAALWRKELHLHQSQFVLAALLALLHLAVLAVRKVGGDFKDSPGLEFVLQHFWVMWLAMPLLVNGAAVAEERRLGTLEAQLCLPSRRRTQFGFKFVSALLLSVGLGFVMPLLLEGPRILPDFDAQFTSDLSTYFITTPDGTRIPLGNLMAAIRVMLPSLTLVGIVAAVAVPCFYASTLARSFLQAIGLGLLLFLAVWFLFLAAAEVEWFVRYPLWRGWLVYLMGVPVMLLVLAALMVWNFKHALVGWPVWRRNFLVWLAALVGITTATAATYHRVWEHFITLEPPHGRAWPALSQPVGMQSGGHGLAVQLADGRNWSSRLNLTVPSWKAMLTGDWKVSVAAGSAGFLDGTNWVSVARSFRDTIGIQRDGSLWVSAQPAAIPTPGMPPASPSPVVVRLAQDADWRDVAVNGSVAFLLKTNGTLWRLGTNRSSWKNWPGFRALTPERIGADTDWSELSVLGHGKIAFQKADGRQWVYPGDWAASRDAESIQADPDVVLHRAPYLDGQKSAASTWTSLPSSRHIMAGVGEDGALRVIANWSWQPTSRYRPLNWGWERERIPLGRETNWLAVAGNRHDIVTLKADGSLWKLRFPADPIKNPDGFYAVPLSRHSDWVALTEAMDGIIALAADGNLWFWAMEERRLYPSAFTLRPLLAASRRPQWIGNLAESPTPR